MVHYPFTEQLCLAQSTVNGGLVSEWETQLNPHFFINEMLNFEAATIIQIFYLLLHQTSTMLLFSVRFARCSSPASLDIKLENSM